VNEEFVNVPYRGAILEVYALLGEHPPLKSPSKRNGRHRAGSGKGWDRSLFERAYRESSPIEAPSRVPRGRQGKNGWASELAEAIGYDGHNSRVCSSLGRR